MDGVCAGEDIAPSCLCWVGPQLLPWSPPVPGSTYQEHEDDGALVDVVQ